MGIDPTFWQGKSVLLTGHTGFKGGWLALWLRRLGADVVGFSLDPPSEPNFYTRARIAEIMHSARGNVCRLPELQALFDAHQPEIVLHLAAQSLVWQSYVEPVETYATNVMGTVNVLEAIRLSGSVRSAVFVTTDKVYENRETGQAFVESDPLGGHDPYSSSKACAELVVESWRRSFADVRPGMALATARSGNVIGGGDWAADRLVPDILRARESGATVQIRNPRAVRPWQHVLEPLSGYLLLAQELCENGEKSSGAWNFGPGPMDAQPVEKIVSQLTPDWTREPGEYPHEAHYLTLDSEMARRHLGWRPRWDLTKALEQVLAWHRADTAGEDMQAFSLAQIAEYMAA